MTEIPQQRSYEQVPTESLRTALELAQEQKWQLLSQIEAVDVTITAILNVIRNRGNETAA